MDNAAGKGMTRETAGCIIMDNFNCETRKGKKYGSKEKRFRNH